MAHVRTQIRNQVIAALAGLPTTGNRVYPGRSLPLDPDRVGGPGLLVYCGNEEVEAVTLHAPAIEEHALLLHLRGVAKASANLEDVLDQIALEVQRAMAQALPDMALIALQVGEDDTLEKPCGLITLTYRMKYHVHADAPDVLL